MYQVAEYKAEAFEIMPSKRVYLFRAGFKGTEIILDKSMEEAVNQIYAEGLELAQPRLYYRTLAKHEVSARLIPDLYSKCQYLTFWVSTLGSEIDEGIQRYIRQEKILLSTLLDAWASEALEELNDSFHEHLQSKYGVGKRRFSPGFGDLDLRVNQELIQMLQVSEVTANRETGILSPIKSTTCLIGW